MDPNKTDLALSLVVEGGPVLPVGGSGGGGGTLGGAGGGTARGDFLIADISEMKNVYAQLINV